MCTVYSMHKPTASHAVSARLHYTHCILQVLFVLHTTVRSVIVPIMMRYVYAGVSTIECVNVHMHEDGHWPISMLIVMPSKFQLVARAIILSIR